MAALTRSIHPSANVKWAKLTELCPDMEVRPVGENEANGSDEPMGLAFFDPDGEMHVYPFTPEGKANLLAQLTGGVIVPDGRNQPPTL